MSKEISDEKLVELSKTLKPVVRKDGKLFYIEDIDPRTSTITWNPKIKAEAIGLVEYIRVPFFSYSYPALWKPSIDEVLVEIQDDTKFIRDCVAFEVVHAGMDTTEGKGNYGTAIFYKLEVHTSEVVVTEYKTSDIPVDSVCLLVTYTEKETLDVIKMAIRVKSNSMLGRNYKHYSEDEVRNLFPKPDKDKTYKVVYVEEINDIILIGY